MIYMKNSDRRHPSLSLAFCGKPEKSLSVSVTCRYSSGSNAGVPAARKAPLVPGPQEKMSAVRKQQTVARLVAERQREGSGRGLQNQLSLSLSLSLSFFLSMLHLLAVVNLINLQSCILFIALFIALYV